MRVRRHKKLLSLQPFQQALWSLVVPHGVAEEHWDLPKESGGKVGGLGFGLAGFLHTHFANPFCTPILQNLVCHTALS